MKNSNTDSKFIVKFTVYSYGCEIGPLNGIFQINSI